jgi:hypothetical protein
MSSVQNIRLTWRLISPPPPGASWAAATAAFETMIAAEREKIRERIRMNR